MRAVVYARSSSDQQRDASIEDQVRICKELIAREGWTLTQVYVDRALTGASSLRPGYQKLLQDAQCAECEVIVAEALDRLSRDQEDIAGLFKRTSGARPLAARLPNLTESRPGQMTATPREPGPGKDRVDQGSWMAAATRILAIGPQDVEPVG